MKKVEQQVTDNTKWKSQHNMKSLHLANKDHDIQFNDLILFTLIRYL